MFPKACLIFAFISMARVIVATPPACLLAAVNQQDNPGDLDTICGKNAKDVQNDIAKICDNTQLTQMAWDAFSDSCKAKGHVVAKPSPTQSSDSSPTSTSSSDDNSASATGSAESAESTGSIESPTEPSNISAMTTATTLDSTGTSTGAAPPAAANTGAAIRLEITFGAAAAGAAAGLLGLL